jgi:effector-binding domain-containing protein
MKRLTTIVALTISFLFLEGCSVFVEEPSYERLKKDGSFELRDYPSVVVAQTTVDASMEEAGGEAFQRLFGYISGENGGEADISMTSPVTQTPSSQEIAMTAPVGQRKTDTGWVVSFVMPESYTLDSLPKPTNPEVKLRQIPERRVAVIKYSGTWSAARYRAQLEKLETWVSKNSLKVTGEAIWARYNPPFTPWFLRRNEIMIPVARPLEEQAG